MCDCLDYTWALNARKVTARYTGLTVSAIATALVGTFAPAGFTLNAGLLATNPVIDEITYTNEELGQALSRLCERAGLYWYVDYARTIFVFSSAAIPSAGTIDDTHPRQAAKLQNAEEFAAIVSRVVARVGGAGATSDAAVGQTTLPIEDPAWYSASGGIVECGPQRSRTLGSWAPQETDRRSEDRRADPSAIIFAPGRGDWGTLRWKLWCAVSSVTNEETGHRASRSRFRQVETLCLTRFQANRPADPRSKVLASV